MLILVDAKTLLAAILLPGSKSAKKILRAAKKHELAISRSAEKELCAVLRKNAPEFVPAAKMFLKELPYVPVSDEYSLSLERISDYPWQSKGMAMVKKEFKRLLFSWATVIFAVCECAAAIISYCSDSLPWVNTLKDMLIQAPVDVDLSRVQTFLDEMNGYEFFFTYYEYSDAVYFAIILAFAWLGIFVCARAGRHKESGYGSYIVSRSGFASYYRFEMAAQTIYIAAVWALAFALQFIIAFAMGGVSGTGYYSYSPLACFGIVLGLYAVFVFYFSCVNIIVSSLMCFIRNGLVLRSIPVVIFALVPLICGDLILRAGVPDSMFVFFSPFYYLTAVVAMLTSSGAEEIFGLLLCSMAVFLFAALAVWKVNSAKMRKNYV